MEQVKTVMQSVPQMVQGGAALPQTKRQKSPVDPEFEGALLEVNMALGAMSPSQIPKTGISTEIKPAKSESKQLIEVSGSEVGQPSISMPDQVVQDVAKPKVEGLDVRTPMVSTSDVSTPDARVSDVSVPNVSMQDVRAQDARRQDVQTRGQSELRASSAEKSPFVQKAATSVNTAAVIAGPKPWSREWVFHGDEDQNPKLQSLVQMIVEGGEGRVPQKKLVSSQAKGESKPVSGVVVNDLISAYLNEMNGEAEEPSVVPERQSVKRANVEGANVESARANTASSSREVPHNYGVELSGSEFIDTLNSVGKELVDLPEEKPLERPIRSSLKMIDGGAVADSKPFGIINPSILAQVGGNDRQAMKAQVAEVKGHVVQGAMARERLSRESLLGVSAKISDLATRPGGGGEIRVRLKPDNLGELNLHVVTRGREVGLRIQASDPGARQILEESLSHLKESLANQHLNLSHVDVSVAKSHAAVANGSFGGYGENPSFTDSNNYQQTHGSLMGQNAGGSQGGSGQEWQWNSRGDNSLWGDVVPNAGGSQFKGQMRRSDPASGRLDVMA